MRIFPEPGLVASGRSGPVDVGEINLSLYRLCSGARVAVPARGTRRFDEEDGDPWRAGFTCHRLDGHPVLGEETFSVETCPRTGRVQVAVRSGSRPRAFTARLQRRRGRRPQLPLGRRAVRELAAAEAAGAREGELADGGGGARDTGLGSGADRGADGRLIRR